MANVSDTYFGSLRGVRVFAMPFDPVTSATHSLAQWSTKAIEIIESASPNQGRWPFVLNTTTSRYWAIFEGASQPTGWDLAVAKIDLYEVARANDLEAVLKTDIAYRYTNNGGVGNYDDVTITEV